MEYANLEFYTQRGSTSITSSRTKQRVHIPFTNRNETIEQGRNATVITTTILTISEASKSEMLELLHSRGAGLLYIGDRFYKKVESGESFNYSPRTPDKKDIWLIGAEFVALDPVPYYTATGDAVYD